MPNELKRVYALPGKLLPSMKRNKHYIGWELLTDASATADHEVPGGNRYRLKRDGELVESDSYIRGAIRDGDITDVPFPAEKPVAVIKSKET